MNNCQYDIFISYRFTQRDWAETLAHNLVAQGYTVFIDAWELYGGQNFTQAIEQALRSSRCAILIATPEAADSGWVQHEYELMFNLKQKGSGFFFVPVVWGEFPDFPFLDVVHAVDFGDSSETRYRAAFQYLLAALQQTAPGPAPYFNGRLKLPTVAPAPAAPVKLAQKQRSFVEDIFTYVDGAMPVMVLAQEGFNTQHYAQALKEKAQARYGENNVLHIFPPASLKASNDQYFARLGRQCGFDAGVSSSWEWAEALEQRLLTGDELFLLATGFENGAEDARRDLAGELRGLIEAHPLAFRLVMMGGERLAAMKYENGSMSFLNKLEEAALPSVCIEDVRALYLARYGGMALSDAALEEVLAFSGQHPRLVEACLRALQQGRQDWRAAVLASSLPTQLFARFLDTAERDALCDSFAQADLGRYSTWTQDVLVRRLYWQNLLKADERGRLVWRCELMTRIGGGVVDVGEKIPLSPFTKGRTLQTASGNRHGSHHKRGNAIFLFLLLFLSVLFLIPCFSLPPKPSPLVPAGENLADFPDWHVDKNTVYNAVAFSPTARRWHRLRVTKRSSCGIGVAPLAAQLEGIRTP
ncbi:MAG: toll/interleukin-1 receptor domain-containing protein [Thiolinea sp.]